MSDFTIVSQEGWIFTVDQIPDTTQVGDVYETPNGATLQVLYVDRDANELGLYPVQMRKERRA